MSARAGLVVGLLLSTAPTGALAEPAVATGGTRADGVVAVVGGRVPGPDVSVVLRSDCVLRARLLLAARAEPPDGPLTPELLDQALDELIGELLIAREARRVRLAAPSADAVAEQRRRVREALGGAQRARAFMEAHGIEEEELEEIARRRAVVGGFLQSNIAGTTTVSDAEVDRAFAEGQHPFIGHELEAAREPLRVWLSRRALDRAVRRWVAVLRARTPVTQLTTFR